ncbi:MAG: hypothetical protein Q8K99_11605 [Actinomycetota bacterium]|nr:hypothetical protein [Actinomycetota bacterium]
MSARPLRPVITVLMNLLVIVAVIDTARIVVSFFGALAATAWGAALIKVTAYTVFPLGAAAIKTPYGGGFDVDAAVTVVALLMAEWLLSVARNRG